ncbi:MAG: signal peptidase II [Omnitrophica bacterium RBG_13_46_9]|nr:MAG: signal peptidase II [Omnitrophica bacterium RBG_13_46_9]
MLSVGSVLVLDQLSKFFVLRNLNPNNSIEVIRNFFYLTLVYNTGAAFGILKDKTFVFVAISLLAVIFIVFYINKRKKGAFPADLGLGLILGGALGNLVDRLRFGYVVDFLDFKIWPVFNIADSAITTGVFLLIAASVIKNFRPRTG